MNVFIINIVSKFCQGMIFRPFSQLPAQIFAGLVLAFVAIPEVMGYAKIAGLPLVTGLYSILFPLIIFSIFSSSRHLVVGLDSSTAVIISAGLASFAVRGSSDWVFLTSVIAISSGLLLMAARFIRADFIANFLSIPTLVAFMSSIGIYIVAHEFIVFLGFHDNAQTLQGLLYDLYQNKHVNFHTLIISGAIVTIILLGKKLAPKIPWYLLIIVISIVATWFFHFKIDTIENIPNGLPKVTTFHAPTLNIHLLIKLLPTIFA
ncbi:MAG: SulP family inorganic anion transporter, partial [Gammaproteobacteria bacterium]|nr:SulP family inorganic anion transporter [Gammaproteobacteria bacterium]